MTFKSNLRSAEADVPPGQRISTFISAQKIAERMETLAAEIAAAYSDPSEPLVLVGLLRGAVPFIGDLSRALARREVPCALDYLTVSSYRGGTESNRAPVLSGELTIDLAGRDVLIVDDILDSGHTLSRVCAHLRTLRPRTLEVCVLLDKPARRDVEISPRFRGFECPDYFVVGYGMDLDDRFRELPFIGLVEQD